MKKIFLLTIAVLFGTAIMAQETVDYITIKYKDGATRKVEATDLSDWYTFGGAGNDSIAFVVNDEEKIVIPASEFVTAATDEVEAVFDNPYKINIEKSKKSGGYTYNSKGNLILAVVYEEGIKLIFPKTDAVIKVPNSEIKLDWKSRTESFKFSYSEVNDSYPCIIYWGYNSHFEKYFWIDRSLISDVVSLISEADYSFNGGTPFVTSNFVPNEDGTVTAYGGNNTYIIGEW